MKQEFSSIQFKAALLAAGLVLQVPAHANDGTIVITGAITDTTCIIEDPSGPNHTKVVQLPKISKSALKVKGDQAGRTPFTISLKDCPADLGNGVKVYFEPGPTTNYATGDLKAYKLAYATNPNATPLNSIVAATPPPAWKSDLQPGRQQNPDGRRRHQPARTGVQSRGTKPATPTNAP